MNYNTNLQTNNTNLQAIYSTVNSLPDKGSLPTIKEYVFTLKDGTTVSKFIEDASLITFTIEDVEYTAEEGMTWGEWVESEYNTDEFVIGCEYCDDNLHHNGSNTVVYDKSNLDNQCKTTTIIANNAYTEIGGGGCLPSDWE